VGIDHAPFKEDTDVYGAAARLQCIGYINFQWGEPEVLTWGECK
jgi:hypothetical protein